MFRLVGSKLACTRPSLVLWDALMSGLLIELRTRNLKQRELNARTLNCSFPEGSQIKLHELFKRPILFSILH